jgi:hypothetical protein
VFQAGGRLANLEMQVAGGIGASIAPPLAARLDGRRRAEFDVFSVVAPETLPQGTGIVLRPMSRKLRTKAAGS